MPQTLKWLIVPGLQEQRRFSRLHKTQKPRTLKRLRNERNLSD